MSAPEWQTIRVTKRQARMMADALEHMEARVALYAERPGRDDEDRPGVLLGAIPAARRGPTRMTRMGNRLEKIRAKDRAIPSEKECMCDVASAFSGPPEICWNCKHLIKYHIPQGNGWLGCMVMKPRTLTQSESDIRYLLEIIDDFHPLDLS